MMNALLYEAPCAFGPNGTTIPNKDRWTEKFNLLALDHVRVPFCLTNNPNLKSWRGGANWRRIFIWNKSE